MNAPTNLPANHPVDISMPFHVPMRDGVRLAGVLYKPGGAAPTPAVLTMTPYSADTYHERGYYFARRGYAFVILDVRGRGNSEGEFIPDLVDIQDGFDAVEWLAQQPWCDGQVTMWGGSYAGMNQWTTLREFPPHLRTIVPAASAQFYEGGNPMRGPGKMINALTWNVLTGGKTTGWNFSAQSDYWFQKARSCFLSHTPFHQIDEVMIGQKNPRFQEWMNHPPHDPFWGELMFTPEQYQKINIPILSIAGHYDDSQRGTFVTYREHLRYGGPAAAQNHFLVVGPWDHAGTRTPRQEVGGLTFGPAALLDLNDLHVAWYDFVMKGGPRPAFFQKRTAYYLMGAEEWRYTDDILTLAQPQRYYLSSLNGQANTLLQSGSLTQTEPETSLPDTYTYDPLDTSPADLEPEAVKHYLTDQRWELNLSGNGLVYHTPPFAQDTELTGWVKLVLWLELDVPDTDFEVTLSEILPDGSKFKLSDDFQRARYRQSQWHEQLVVAGEINRYEFDRFTLFSKLVRKGSRLRLFIHCPNYVTWEKNYNSGGVVGFETASQARTAHIKLYHDPAHPSFLELPVVDNP